MRNTFQNFAFDLIQLDTHCIEYVSVGLTFTIFVTLCLEFLTTVFCILLVFPSSTVAFSVWPGWWICFQFCANVCAFNLALSSLCNLQTCIFWCCLLFAVVDCDFYVPSLVIISLCVFYCPEKKSHRSPLRTAQPVWPGRNKTKPPLLNSAAIAQPIGIHRHSYCWVTSPQAVRWESYLSLYKCLCLCSLS